MGEVFKNSFGKRIEGADGKKPVVFDILSPDMTNSILPDDIKLVLEVNPRQMDFSSQKLITKIQTHGGFVNQHWGEGTRVISFSGVTGGFKRLYTGLTSTTGNNFGGNRRQSINYDVFLDLLALFKNNGSVYDVNGKIVFQGAIKMYFDGFSYIGWFDSFTVEENAEKPFMFNFNMSFTVKDERWLARSTPYNGVSGQVVGGFNT